MVARDDLEYIEYEAKYIERMTENVKNMRQDHRNRILKLLELPGIDIPGLLKILGMTDEKSEE